MVGMRSNGKYISDRYTPGVRYTMPVESHLLTLNALQCWTTNAALDQPLANLPAEADEEEEDELGMDGEGMEVEG